jgi:hypothetical protein
MSGLINNRSLPNGYKVARRITLRKNGVGVTVFIIAAEVLIAALLFAVGVRIVPFLGLRVNVNIGDGYFVPPYIYTIAALPVMVLLIIVLALAKVFLCSAAIKTVTGKKPNYVLRKGAFHIGSNAYYTRTGYFAATLTPVITLFIFLTLLKIVLPWELFWWVYILQIINLATSVRVVANLRFIFFSKAPTLLLMDDGEHLEIYTPLTSHGYVGAAERVIKYGALILAVLCIFLTAMFARNLMRLRGYTPPWDTPEFRNAAHTAYESCGTLANSLEIFARDYYERTDFPFPWTLTYMPPVSHGTVRHMQQIFTDTIISAWEQDELSRVMPFNSAYLQYILDQTVLYLAPLPQDVGILPHLGFYNRDRRLNINHMFIGLSPDVTPGTGIHEIGRACGLGDSLTNLFAEEFLGRRRGVALWGDVQGDYHTYFDRVLLNRVGPVLFWEAAFSSNHAYGALWDAHLGDVIAFECLMLARGFVRDLDTISLELLHAYHSWSGESLPWVYYINMPERFMNAFDNNGTLGEGELARIVSALESLAEFARQHPVPPYVSVRDNTIYGFENRIIYIFGIGLSLAAAVLFLLIARQAALFRKTTFDIMR